MKLSDVLDKPFPTPFDDMSFHLDVASKGGYIRDKLLEFENRFGEVSELATIAAHRADIAKAKLQAVMDLALIKIEEECQGRKVSIAMKQAMAKHKEVIIPGDTEAITPYKMERTYIGLSYIAQRGKDKVREVNNVIELGRSILSWDRMEISSLER